MPGSWQPVLFDEPCVRGVFSFRGSPPTITGRCLRTPTASRHPIPSYLNGVLLTEGTRVLTIRPEVFVPAPPVGQPPPAETSGSRTSTSPISSPAIAVALDLADGLGNFTATVRVVAYTDTSVDPFEVDTERYLNFRCIRDRMGSGLQGQARRVLRLGERRRGHGEGAHSHRPRLSPRATTSDQATSKPSSEPSAPFTRGAPGTLKRRNS